MDYSKQRFERLFKDSYPHMYRMAFSMVEDAADAKDAVNQVFAQMWKGKPKVSTSLYKGILRDLVRRLGVFPQRHFMPIFATFNAGSHHFSKTFRTFAVSKQ